MRRRHETAIDTDREEDMETKKRNHNKNVKTNSDTYEQTERDIDQQR